MTTKYEKAEDFEKKLRHIYRMAVVAGLLHKGTAWLGAATLTWATVVLMGGFASQISLSDFKWITVLVVLIVALLALSQFSIKLVTKETLFIGSINPVRFTYRDHHPFFVSLINLASLSFQLLLISVCLWKGFSNCYRSDFKSVHFYSFLFNSSPASSSNADPAAPLQQCLETCFSNASFSTASAAMATTTCIDSSTHSDNLQICLYSFFLLLNSTSICASFCLVYGWMVQPLVWGWLVEDRKCLSLRRYHDEVLSRAMNLGLAESDDFDSRLFLLRALGVDLMMRNIGPLEVRRQNLGVIEYLYNHPQGSEMVFQGLASGDTLLQQAAVNIVGFWAQSNMRLDTQLELLCRMSDKLGLPGKAAEGAANSFSALAKQWALGTSNMKPNEETAQISSKEAAEARWALLPVPKTKPIEKRKMIEPIEPSPLLYVYASKSRAAAGRGGGAAAPADGAVAGGRASGIVPTDDAAAGGRAGVPTDGAAAEIVRTDDAAAAVPADGAVAGGRGSGIVSTDDEAAGGGAGVPTDGAAAEIVRTDDAAAAGGGAAAPTDGYNVVDKVIDLILHKLAPTLLIYVRALDSFFMSPSVRRHVSTTGRQNGLEEKLKDIIIKAKGTEMQPRTRLIAFFALCRLRSSDGVQIQDDAKQLLEELLNSVDGTFKEHLDKEAAGKKIVWVEESERYKDICTQLGKPRGAWLALVKINGKDMVAPGPPSGV